MDRVITTEEVRLLYEGKYFYEIIKLVDIAGKDYINLYGPIDDIRYSTASDQNGKKANFTYLQIIDGVIKQAFTKDEILVTDRKL